MSDPPADGQVLVLRRWSEVAVGLIGSVLPATFVLVLVLRGPEPSRLSMGEFVGGVLVVSVGLWFIGAVLTSKTVLFERGVLVQNWFNQYWVPWSAVASIEVDPAVTLLLRDGTEVDVGVGGGSLLNALRGNRYQRRVRARIEQVRATAPPAVSEESNVVHARRPGIRRFLGWAVLFFGLALVSGHLF